MSKNKHTQTLGASAHQEQGFPDAGTVLVVVGSVGLELRDGSCASGIRDTARYFGSAWARPMGR